MIDEITLRTNADAEGSIAGLREIDRLQRRLLRKMDGSRQSYRNLSAVPLVLADGLFPTGEPGRVTFRFPVILTTVSFSGSTRISTSVVVSATTVAVRVSDWKSSALVTMTQDRASMLEVVTVPSSAVTRFMGARELLHCVL